MLENKKEIIGFSGFGSIKPKYKPHFVCSLLAVKAVIELSIIVLSSHFRYNPSPVKLVPFVYESSISVKDVGLENFSSPRFPTLLEQRICHIWFSIPENLSVASHINKNAKAQSRLQSRKRKAQSTRTLQ